jgi:sortase (surface protein transpeptidase)
MWKANGKTTTLYFSWIVSFQSGDIIYVRVVRGKMEYKKMRKRTWEAARWLWIALCGGTVLEEALDLLLDRIQ